MVGMGRCSFFMPKMKEVFKCQKRFMQLTSRKIVSSVTFGVEKIRVAVSAKKIVIIWCELHQSQRVNAMIVRMVSADLVLVGVRRKF